ncbi:DUF3267 domain-containing protein [Dorea sp. YH-dor226]|uniref:DUF3267 domain-containing protein n=1 Tax=Dorea sp. YH-dor226 TaxID=3151119 RepID=UPI00324245AA
MKKEKKPNMAKQKIIENYERQKQQYLEAGYEERQETISIVRANVMAFVTAGPFVVLGLILWFCIRPLSKEGNFVLGNQAVCFLVLFLVCIFVHELLHGVGWVFWTQNKWKSIYLGMMWEYLTPYCHCKEPLGPGQYLVGGLAPFAVLGIGMYLAALVSSSILLLSLSLFNILAAGGDTTIACMLFRYLKYDKCCYILDHPTDCGFVAFVKQN